MLPNQRRSGCTRPGVTSLLWNSASCVIWPEASRTALLLFPLSMLTRLTDLASR